ncbi:MAG: amidohydrolase family protein [Kofleriaceae bacterium]
MACSDELLAGIAALAKTQDVPTHVHSHISQSSANAHLDAFRRTETQRLHDAGMLSPRCTLMHAGWLSDDDIAALRSAGVTVNHNPIGNAMLGFGTVRARSVPRLLAAGVPIVLGSDFAPFAISTPFESMRATLLLHRDLLATDNALTLEQALTMATNGSVPLGRAGQIGGIRVGQRADLILVDITGPHHLGVDHPVPALALHGRAADVSTVIVDGRLVIDERQLVGIDEHEVDEAARRALVMIAEHV